MLAVRAKKIRSHQSWGMRHNFSVYANVWDKIMGTGWDPLETEAQKKYAKGRAAAEEWAAMGIEKPIPPQTKGASTAVEL